MPFERARTLLALGERLRRAKQRAEAREPLTAALDAFERLGARPWAERARTELRATGGQAGGRRAQAAAEQLTPHELQIAVLVSQGMTNREAAAALFLSPKTIEYHLGQIYRKLDVRGRAQLARLMAMELPEGERDPAVLADALSLIRRRTSRPERRRSPAAAGVWRSARAGSSSSSVLEQVGVRLDPARLAALGARHRGDVDRVQRGPRAVAAGALGEPVHDRVAAVAQDDEQHAGLVGGRAPQRLDLVERRAVADHGQHRAVGPRHPHADRGGQGEAEHPHRADEAQRRGGGDPRVQLGAARRRLLEQDRVAREPLGERGEDVAGAAAARRVAAAAAAAGGVRCGVRRPGRASTASASAAQIAAGAPSTASSTGLRCASSGSCVTSASRVLGSTSGPGSYGYWRSAPVPTIRTAS